MGWGKRKKTLEKFDNEIRRHSDKAFKLYKRSEDEKKVVNDLETQQLKAAIYLYREPEIRKHIRDEAEKYNYPKSKIDKLELYLQPEFSEDNVTNEIIKNFRNVELFIETEKKRKNYFVRIIDFLCEVFNQDNKEEDK